MKATVKLYKNDGDSEGVYPVKLIVTHKKKIRRKTIGYARENDWDDLQDLPKPSHDDFENLYPEILNIRAKAVGTAFKRLEDVGVGIRFFEDRQVVTQDFFSFGARQVESMKKQGRDGNAEAYEYALKDLGKYKPVISFEEITRPFMTGYKEYCKERQLKNTTIKTYLAELRAIYNKAVSLGMCQDKEPFKDILRDVPVKIRRRKNQYLDKKAITLLKQATGLTPGRRKNTDFALLQFYLCGADMTDVYHLRWEQIGADRVWLNRDKLGAKRYDFDVALLPEAKAIIEKYGDRDAEYVFPYSKNPTRYKTWLSNHRRAMREVLKQLKIPILPMGGLYGSKVMRKTFATLGKFEGIDPDILRELMGHERYDIDTAYKDKFPQKVRDEAHKRIVY